MLSVYHGIPVTPYILLAEDDEDDGMLFNDAFKESGLNLQLVILNDGMELMDYLFMVKDQLPKLIFLDLNMPVKNGFECLRDLKNNKKLSHIPVIVYTTSNSNEDYEKCRQLKAHVYITKPDSFTKLKHIIQKVLTTDFVNNPALHANEKLLVFRED
ncbi:MAG TPA: response regulator [Bacteroidia bacterium]|nr:response regulator [Bacteroidia bacterium]